MKCVLEGQGMASTEEIIRDAESLPVEERARVVDRLLRTLNAPDPRIDREWMEVVKRRDQDLRSGRTKPVPGEDVFRKARERFRR